MRLKRRPLTVSGNANKQLPGLTFNNSLLAWHAKWKAERNPQGVALKKVLNQAAPQE